MRQIKLAFLVLVFSALLAACGQSSGPVSTKEYVLTTALENRYVHHRRMATGKTMVIGGPAVRSQEEMTRRLGYSAGWSDSVASKASWSKDGMKLLVTTDLVLETSQGSFPATKASFSSSC